MKKIITAALLLLVSSMTFAKKVKFSVDMTGVDSIDAYGIHIVGDFQMAAGFPADFDPTSTEMFKEQSNPNIYSVVVNIPAFKAYQFQFVNGNGGYGLENVPVPSRVGKVGTDFIANRWIWIDSLSNDTQDVRKIIFAGNAPSGYYLLRFKVDMQNVSSISPDRVHVAGNFQGWNTKSSCLYSFDGKVFEYITYVNKGAPTVDHEFKYYNGNTLGTQESVPAACDNANMNRSVFVSSDTVLSIVCFSQCTPCSGNDVVENKKETSITISPNPVSSSAEVKFNSSGDRFIVITDIYGKIVSTYKTDQSSLRVEKGNLNAGVYFITIRSGEYASSAKLIIE